MPNEMDNSSSSEIIPFPDRFRLSVDATARLERAIHGLDQAYNQLRDHISCWRAGPNALTVNLGEIADNLQILDTGWADL
jgi:hypothetical protein